MTRTTTLLASSVIARGDVTPPIPGLAPTGMLTIVDPATGETVSLGSTDPVVLDRIAATAMVVAENLRAQIEARATKPAPEKPVLRVVTTEGRS